MKQITNLADLEALPEGAVFLDRHGNPWRADAPGCSFTTIGISEYYDAEELVLWEPFTLLWPLPEPEYEYGVHIRHNLFDQEDDIHVGKREDAEAWIANGGGETQRTLIRRTTVGEWEEVEAREKANE